MKKWGGCSWIWWKFHCNQIITHFIIYHLQCLFIINMTMTSLSHGSTALIVFIKQIHPRAAFLLQTIWCWIVRSGQGCVGQPQWISISCERELPPGANCYTPDQLKVGCTSSPELSWNPEVCICGDEASISGIKVLKHFNATILDLVEQVMKVLFYCQHIPQHRLQSVMFQLMINQSPTYERKRNFQIWKSQPFQI